MKRTVAFTCCVALWGAVLVPATEPRRADLNPDLDYQAERSQPVTYDVDFSLVVTPPAQTQTLKVWLPLPTSDRGQELSSSQLSTFPQVVTPRVGTESRFGNRFAYFEFKAPRGAQIVRHQFRITVWELHWNVEPERLAPVAEWPVSFDKYRRSETQAIVVDDRFSRLLNEIGPRRERPFDQFQDVLSWVNSHFTYDHHNASLQASSEHGLTQRRGHCSDYHGFCASMGRALGVPTRITYGLHPFPKNSPSHCKLEAFLAPYGWVSFDVSETQKLMATIRASAEHDESARQDLLVRAAQRLARGFRDNTWFRQTRGSDYDLEPPASRRVAVVRTAYVEADGVPLAEPDPADPGQRAFSWMTVHDYRPDRAVTYPFANLDSLQPRGTK